MIEPVNNYLLVEFEPEQEKTSGGLYMPQGSNANATDILKKAKILAVSEKAVEKLKVKVGDNVLYNKHAVTKIPQNPTQALIRLEDVYAIES